MTNLLVNAPVPTNTNAVAISQPPTSEQHADSNWHNANISAPEATVVAALIGAGMVLLGWIINYKIAANASRKARLEAYEAFLTEWEERIKRTNSAELHVAYFAEGVSQFKTHAIQVRRDLGNSYEFNRLANALSGFTALELGGDVAFSKTRSNLLSAIQALIGHVQKA